MKCRRTTERLTHIFDSATLKGQYFNGPPQLVVAPGATANYTLTFKPAWVCDVTGELVLLNTVTNDKYIYTLHVRVSLHLLDFACLFKMVVVVGSCRRARG